MNSQINRKRNDQINDINPKDNPFYNLQNLNNGFNYNVEY